MLGGACGMPSAARSESQGASSAVVEATVWLGAKKGRSWKRKEGVAAEREHPPVGVDARIRVVEEVREVGPHALPEEVGGYVGPPSRRRVARW